MGLRQRLGHGQCGRSPTRAAGPADDLGTRRAGRSVCLGDGERARGCGHAKGPGLNGPGAFRIEGRGQPAAQSAPSTRAAATRTARMMTAAQRAHVRGRACLAGTAGRCRVTGRRRGLTCGGRARASLPGRPPLGRRVPAATGRGGQRHGPRRPRPGGRAGPTSADRRPGRQPGAAPRRSKGAAAAVRPVEALGAAGAA